MFSLRRAAVRAISSRVSPVVATQPRSITTLTNFVTKSTKPSSILPLLQKRFASDIPSEQHPALGNDGQPSAPETTSAGQFDASDVDPIAPKEIPYSEPEDSAVRSPERSRNGLNAPNKQLYIGNLFFDVTEEDLRREMSRYGTVTNLKIIKDSRGISKGFAYVDFLDQTDATSAVEGLDRQVFEGRRLSVQYANRRNLDAIPRERARLRNNATAPPSKTLYIGNLSFDLSDQDMSQLFSTCKNILDVRVAVDRRTGQPRGFAHADFTDIESAEQAFAKLNGKEVYGRQLRCDYSGPSSRVRQRTDM